MSAADIITIIAAGGCVDILPDGTIRITLKKALTGAEKQSNYRQRQRKSVTTVTEKVTPPSPPSPPLSPLHPPLPAPAPTPEPPPRPHIREAVGKPGNKRQQIETDITAADHTPVPLELNTQPFRDAWNDWCLHRAELYRRTPTKRWSAQAASNTLAECARHGPEIAVMAINAAIANGWQGLVWERLQPTQSSANPAKWTAPKSSESRFGPAQPDKWKNGNQ